MSESLKILIHKGPSAGQLAQQISSDSDKQFPSDWSRKLDRKNQQFLFTLSTIDDYHDYHDYLDYCDDYHDFRDGYHDDYHDDYRDYYHEA